MTLPLPDAWARAARVPPSNQQAEHALLGALLVNNRAFEAVASFLQPEHFVDPVNGQIFAACAGLIDAGRLADALTLKAQFEQSGVLDEVGGMAYLAQLVSAMVSVSAAGEYGRAIHDAWHRRQLIDIAQTLMDRAYGDGERTTAVEIHEAAEGQLFSLGEAGQVDDAASPAHEPMRWAIDAAYRASQAPTGLVGITTGLRELDDLLGGLRNGKLYVLGARPSMGKTALGMRIATGAVLAGARVLFISREMTRQDIGAALVAGLARLPRDAAERGKTRGRDASGQFVYTPIDQDAIDAMVRAQRSMIDRTMIIDECRSGTMASVRAAARRMKRRGGCDVVVIDYLGLMRVPELAKHGNRQLEVSRISEQAKALARDLDVPVLLLSQLSRANEGRDDKRPVLSDLRDSGSIEQDADVVMFLHREDYYLSRSMPGRRADETEEKFANRSSQWLEARSKHKGRAEVNVAKHRGGAVGSRVLAWGDEMAWFDDYEGDATNGQ